MPQANGQPEKEIVKEETKEKESKVGGNEDVERNRVDILPFALYHLVKRTLPIIFDGKKMMNEAERQKMYMELALRVSMRKDFDYSLGPVKYSASRRQNAVMISFPINLNVLLVSAEPTVDIDKFANKIMKTIGLQ